MRRSKRSFGTPYEVPRCSKRRRGLATSDVPWYQVRRLTFVGKEIGTEIPGNEHRFLPREEKNVGRPLLWESDFHSFFLRPRESAVFLPPTVVTSRLSVLL